MRCDVTVLTLMYTGCHPIRLNLGQSIVTKEMGGIAHKMNAIKIRNDSKKMFI